MVNGGHTYNMNSSISVYNLIDRRLSEKMSGESCCDAEGRYTSKTQCKIK